MKGSDWLLHEQDRTSGRNLRSLFLPSWLFLLSIRGLARAEGALSQKASLILLHRREPPQALGINMKEKVVIEQK